MLGIKILTTSLKMISFPKQSAERVIRIGGLGVASYPELERWS
jgi:hypothetical protein